MLSIIKRISLAILCTTLLFTSCSDDDTADGIALGTPDPTVEYRSSSFEVKWPAVDNADGYGYILDDGSEQTTTQCVLAFDDLEFGSAHTLKIRALNGSGLYAPSAWAVRTIDLNDARLLGKAELTVSGIRIDGFTVEWSAVKNAEYYETSIDDGEVLNVYGTSVSFDGVTADVHTVKVRPATSDTDFDEAEWSSVEVRTVTELDTGGTANCYIVTESGFYSFDATTIGNGAEGIIAGADFHTEDPKIAPAAAELLWQDYYADGRGLISQVGLTGDGRVFFEVPDPFVTGNAAIAVCDDGGVILWSWHIWLSEVDFTAAANVHHYYCPLYDPGFDVMDRNLGATSAIAQHYTSIGLHYQWGRKDPFVTSQNIEYFTEFNKGGPFALSTPTYDIDGKAIVPVSISRGGADFEKDTWAAVKANKTNGTIANTIAYPMNFLVATSYWFYGGSSAALWGNPNETATQPNPDHGRKSIYDPCPAGWRVAPQETFRYFQATPTTGVPNTTLRSKYGYHFFYDETHTAWFPANAYRLRSTGCISSCRSGCYWTSSPYSSSSANASYLSFYHPEPADTDTPAEAFWCATVAPSQGCGVRCVKEL